MTVQAAASALRSLSNLASLPRGTRVVLSEATDVVLRQMDSLSQELNDLYLKIDAAGGLSPSLGGGE